MIYCKKVIHETYWFQTNSKYTKKINHSNKELLNVKYVLEILKCFQKMGMIRINRK